MNENNGKMSIAEWREYLIKKIDRIDERLDEYFGPDGFCHRRGIQVDINRSEIKSLKKWQWFIMVAIILSALGTFLK